MVSAVPSLPVLSFAAPSFDITVIDSTVTGCNQIRNLQVPRYFCKYPTTVFASQAVLHPARWDRGDQGPVKVTSGGLITTSGGTNVALSHFLM